ncbi:MAG: T9SS type A sorting domain-containing protein [Bacteroidales bacterium]|nr:T9SS type A sorting domain-containing protein [Bacteroidales bacterium]
MKSKPLKKAGGYLMIWLLLFVSFATLTGQDFDLSSRPKMPDEDKKISTNSMIPVVEKQDEVSRTASFNDEPLSGPVPESLMIPGEGRITGVTKIAIPITGNSTDEIQLLTPVDEPPVPAKSTGTLSYANDGNYTIPTSNYITTVFTCSETLPEGAVVTGFMYSVRIDDNGDENDFYPYDYEIYLSSETHFSASGYYYLRIFDNPGSTGSHTDDGCDDDVGNDTDINLVQRTTSAFNGEDATEWFSVRFVDNFGATSGNGILDWVYVWVSWEAPDPNLIANYTPTNWDGPIVVSDATGTNTDAEAFYTGVTYYIDFAIINRDQDIDESFTDELWVDGMYQNHWTYSGLNKNYYYAVLDQPKVFSTAGEHYVATWADSYDVIDESNESDNIMYKYFDVYGPPAAPTLSLPGNGSACKGSVVGFDWDEPEGTVSYRLLVDDDPGWGSPLMDLAGITSSFYTKSGFLPGTTYYWAVQGTNPAGNSSWSSVNHFSTAPVILPSPDLMSPADEASCQSLTPTLEWYGVSGAESYAFQVDDNSDFSSPLYDYDGIGSTVFSISGLSLGTTYYWRAAAKNSCGRPSEWSDTYEFTTLWYPAAPVLSGPADEAACQATSLSLSWGSVSGASGYHLVVDNNSDLGSPEINEVAVAGTSYALSGLSGGSTYYWTVRATNSCGVNGDWATSREFYTTMAAPSAVTLSAPADGSTCQAVPPSLSWAAATHADHYILQVDNNDNFSSPEYYKDDVSGTSQSVTGLSEGTTYYWRSKAVNGCGTEGPWSSVNDFTTTISSVAIPAPASPVDEATCQALNTTLSWASASNAVSYALQLDDNADFSSPLVDQSVAGTSYNCSGLSETTEYFWRVKGVGSCSMESDWTTSRSFQTGSAGLDAPELSSPADMSGDQSLSLTLSWDAVGDATVYQVQLDDNEDFSSPLLDEQLSGTSIEASGLAEETSYYWHVQAAAACASSDWSATWEFETLGGEDPPDAIEVTEGLGYSLKQNQPNPFTESSCIEFSIPVDAGVTFEVVSMEGKLIFSRTQFYQTGKHMFVLRAGQLPASGVYIYRMKTNDFVDTRLCIVR